jgi:hypothetical protein
MSIVTLRDFRFSTAVFAGSSVVFILGLLLLAASWWVRPISEAEQAMRDGHLEQALAGYAVVRERFEKVPISRSLLPGVYDVVTANELSLQYSLERYDDILEKAGTSGGNDAASFWAGCALFDKGLLEEKPDARVGWISQAHQEFRRALELTPDDWDTKFNFELTGKLTSGLQKQPQTSKQDMMKLLRESPKTDRQPVRKIG